MGENPENRFYNGSFDNFIASGGDGYSMLAALDTYNESIFSDSDAFAYYVTNILSGEIPENIKNIKGELI